MQNPGQRTPKFLAIAATADGANTIIAAIAGTRIQVISYVVMVTTSGNVEFQDTDGTVLATFPLSANGGVSYAGGLYAPAIETLPGKGLRINNPAGVDTYGHLCYLETAP